MSLCLWLSGLPSSEFESLWAGWQAWISSQSPHLARCFDAFPDAEVDNSEDRQDAEDKLPADAAQVLESRRAVDLQDVAPGVKETERPRRWYVQ